MSGVWVPPGKQRFVNPTTGEPLIGGFVYHYVPGTDTLKDTWSDQGQAFPNANPIVLDGDGQAIIWGTGLYRQRLTDANGVEIWDQVTGFSSSGGGGGGVDFATPLEVAQGLVTDKAISPYALNASGVLALPYASPGEVAAGAVANKVISPQALALSGVVPVKATAGEVAALSNDAKFITPKALGDSGVLGGGGGGGNVPAVTDYGFIGDGVTDNASHMAAMLASSSWDMRVPTGIFYISGDGPTQRASMRKRFYGPGRFLFDDGYCTPGRYSNISVAPALWPTQGVTGWFHGETMSVEGEWHVLGPTVRESPTARYFEGATIPHNIWYDVNSGASGLLTIAQGALVAGAGSALLISSDGISPGQVLGVTPWGQDGAITDTITIDTVVGNTITFHPNLTTNYPNSVPNGAAPGRAVFISGKRTWAGIQYFKVAAGAQGGGDVYGAIARLSTSYVAKAGQVHVFNTMTMGLFGGSMDFLAGSTGSYGTGWENQADDQNNDVAYSAFVDTFNRRVDVGGRSAFWAGHVMQSGGGRPVDTGIVQRGFFRFGLDAVMASLEDTTFFTAIANAGQPTITVNSYRGMLVGDPVTLCILGVPQETLTVASINYGANQITFTTNLTHTYGVGERVTIPHGGAALNLAMNDVAVVFNSTVSNNARSGDPTGTWGPQYGNVTGDLIMRSVTDVTSDAWVVQFNRAAPNNGRIRLRPNGFQSNVGLGATGSVIATGDVVTGGLLGLGVGSGIYFFTSGGHLFATNNGGTTSVMVV